MPGGRVSRFFMIFGGFDEFGLELGNVEKSRIFDIFVLFEFVADLDRVKRVRDRSGGKS